MTSFGNTMNNIALTEAVYRKCGIANDMVGGVFLGDDNLTIFKGDCMHKLQEI
jgi:hypothetical protein